MKYRVTALTPLLVGDGNKLSPIDYMVWRDQINVLDQKRIFRLLSRGPRLDGYLAQLRRADKLDFASWGGFAQNYSSRRILFEHASSTTYWERVPAEFLHIPTFCSGPRGQYLPASALKGALRTGWISSRFNTAILKGLVSREGDRLPRRPGEAAESAAVGGAQADPVRNLKAADTGAVSDRVFKIYLLRVATLQQRSGSLELGWKQAPHGTVPGRSPESSTPLFAEMAVPGTSFEGEWSGRRTDKVFSAANDHAASLIEKQIQYADTAKLQRVSENLQRLSAHVGELRKNRNACLLNLGWGGGFLTKSGSLDTGSEEYREVLRRLPYYERGIRTGLPFPKTRKIVFEGDRPSTLPGWVSLEIF